MICNHVAAFGRARPGRSLTGKGDLLQAKACLVADHGPGTALAFQAVAHSNAGRFALNCQVKLSAAAGGASSHGRLHDHPYPRLLAQRAAIALPNRGTHASLPISKNIRNVDESARPKRAALPHLLTSE